MIPDYNGSLLRIFQHEDSLDQPHSSLDSLFLNTVSTAQNISHVRTTIFP